MSSSVSGAVALIQPRGPSRRTLILDRMACLVRATDSLMAKLHTLVRLLESERPSETYWRSGILPDLPKLCIFLTRKFPEEPRRLLETGALEKVDKAGLESLRASAEVVRQEMEPWYLLYVDLMLVKEEAVKLLLEASTTIVLVSVHHNALILSLFMDLVCGLVRLNMLADKTPKRLIVQTFGLVHILAKSGVDAPHYPQLVHFLERYEPSVKGLQEDLVIGSRVGEALESVAPLLMDVKNIERLRSEMLLHPRRASMTRPRQWGQADEQALLTGQGSEFSEPEIVRLLESTVSVERFQDWLLWGYLVCPGELLLGKGIDALVAVLSESFVGILFRDIYVMIHEEYDRHALPKLKEVAKSAKGTRSKQPGWDSQYQAAKAVIARIGESSEVARTTVDAVHRLRRTMIKQELMQCLHCLRDDPSLTATSIRAVLAVLALSRSEVLWYFRHVNVPVFKSKSGILQAANAPIPVPVDSLDPTIGFLLDGITAIRSIIKKQSTDVAAWAEIEIRASLSNMLSILRSNAGVDVERDAVLRRHLAALWEAGSNLGGNQAPPPTASPATSMLSLDLGSTSRSLVFLRLAWSDTLVHVSSTRSGMNVRYLDKSTGADRPRSLVGEGNLVYNLSRLIDDLPQVLAESSTLKELCYFRPQLSQVFRHTMFGLEGRPQHCCAWLHIPPMFPENAHENVTSELAKLNELAVDYMESLIESVMAGVDGLISVIMGEHCLGLLDAKVAPSQGAKWMSQVEPSTTKKSRAAKRGVVQEPLPGFESQTTNREMLRTMEAAILRLTNLCAAIGHLDPIIVANEVFDPKEFLHERLLNLFRARIFNSLLPDNGDLDRPSAIEAEIRRLVVVAWMIEQHTAGLPVSAALRDVMLAEAFTGGLASTSAVPATSASTVKREEGEWVDGVEKFKAVRIVGDWYMANLARDVRGSGVYFSPLRCQLSNARSPDRRWLLERASCRTEMEALVRVFGPHICDGVETMLASHARDLLQQLGMGLQRNREGLAQLQCSLHLPISREEHMRALVDLEPLIAACTELGHCISLRRLLQSAASRCLRSAAPILLDVAEDIVTVTANQSVKDSRAAKLLRSASVVGGGTGQTAAAKGDIMFVYVALQNMGALDPPWALLPLLFAALVAVNPSWATASFNPQTGGFSNNAQGLARCITSCIFAAALAEDDKSSKRLEILRTLPVEGPFPGKITPSLRANNNTQRLGHSNNVDTLLETEGLRLLRQFLQGASATILSSALEDGRKGASFAIKLRFLHHLAENCPFLPRGTLEDFIPSAVFRGLLRRTGLDHSRRDEQHAGENVSSMSRHSTSPRDYHVGDMPDIHQPQQQLKRRSTTSPFLSIFSPALRRRSYDSQSYSEEIMAEKDEEHRPRRGSYSGVMGVGGRLLRGQGKSVAKTEKQAERTSSGMFHSGPILQRSSSSAI